MTSDFHARLMATSIDGTSLLSSDYLNHFNEIIMLLDLLPETPEMRDEIEAWQFLSYADYFRQSKLGFASLAVEAYERSPHQFRNGFDTIVQQMHAIIDEARGQLRSHPETLPDLLAEQISSYVQKLHDLVDRASALTHGCII